MLLLPIDRCRHADTLAPLNHFTLLLIRGQMFSHWIRHGHLVAHNLLGSSCFVDGVQILLIHCVWHLHEGGFLRALPLVWLLLVVGEDCLCVGQLVLLTLGGQRAQARAARLVDNMVFGFKLDLEASPLDSGVELSTRLTLPQDDVVDSAVSECVV